MNDLIKTVREAVKAATPGPWYRRFLDDGSFMNLVAVCTTPDTGNHEALPHDDEDGKIRKSIIATTLLQANADVIIPVSVETENWDEDAFLIANAPEWLLQLCDLAEAKGREIETYIKLVDYDTAQLNKLEQENAELRAEIDFIKKDRDTSERESSQASGILIKKLKAAVKALEQIAFIDIRHMDPATAFNKVTLIASQLLSHIKGGGTDG